MTLALIKPTFLVLKDDNVLPKIAVRLVDELCGFVQEFIGEAAGKLHTGRSRNDQVRYNSIGVFICLFTTCALQ